MTTTDEKQYLNSVKKASSAARRDLEKAIKVLNPLLTVRAREKAEKTPVDSLERKVFARADEARNSITSAWRKLKL